MSFSDSQMDKLGASLASHLKPLFGDRSSRRRSPQRSFQWQRGRNGKGGARAVAKAQWAKDAICYFCHCYGHTASDHEVPYPWMGAVDTRWHESQKWFGIVSRLANDVQSGEQRDPHEVAKDVGVSVSHFPNLQPKRALALIVHMKIGGAAWVADDMIGTKVPPDKVTTPGEYCGETEMSTDDEPPRGRRRAQGAEGTATSYRPKGSKAAEAQLPHGFTAGWKNSVDKQLSTLTKETKRIGAKQGEQSGLMKLLLQANGVPQEEVDKVIKDNELVDEDQGESPRLYGSQPDRSQKGAARTQPHIDADMDSQDDQDALLSRLVQEDASSSAQDAAKRKWLTDPGQTAASWQSISAVQDAVLSISPHLFEIVARLRSRVDLVFVLAQLTPQGVFAVMTSAEAKEHKFEPCMFDDTFVVVPVRVAARGMTENTVSVIQCDKPDEYTFKCPPYQNNNGFVCSLEKIWGSAEAAVRATTSSMLNSPLKRRTVGKA